MRRSRAALFWMLAAGCATTARPGAAPPVLPPAPSARELLRGYVDSLVGAPEFRNAHWGVLIVDPERGDTLYSRNAGKLFLPASNQKIITAAVALAQLGPDYRFRTTYARRGRMRGDTLVGDIVVVGRGDPSVSDHMRVDAMLPLREVADSLRARGIRVITGGVVAGGNAFPDAPPGFGWAWDDLDFSYSAGVDELLFNEGFTRVLVRGGRSPGDSVRIALAPAAGYPDVVVAATTGGPVTRPRGRDLTLTADPARPRTVVLRGAILPGDTTTIEVAHRDPAAAYLVALRQALRGRGVVIRTDSALRRAPVRTASRAGRGARRTSVSDTVRTDTLRADTLFTIFSPTLAEIMPALQKPSQNQIAEVLFRTLGLERLGVGSADSGRVVVERQLAAWGVDSSGFAIRDGSGLSRHDYLSPETIVRVLDAMRRAPYFGVFYHALPVAGVDGTIAQRMRGTPAQGNVHAKTGYVDRARSLSGYVTDADGRMLLFSMLANNWTVPVKSVERVQDAVAVRLATLRLEAAPAAPVAGR